MPIAHVCQQCGQGLARVRPQREPHYGLRVVRCPRCRWTCVRGKPFATEAWNTLQRRGWVFGLLAVKAAVTALLLLIMCLTVATLYDGEFRLTRANKPDGYWIALAILVVVLPIATGAWLSAAFTHLDRRKVFGTWAGLIALGILVASCILGIVGEVDGVAHDAWRTEPWSGLASAGIRQAAPACLGLLALLMLIATAGIPVGRVAQSAKRVIDRRHFRWRLKRRRLRRSHA